MFFDADTDIDVTEQVWMKRQTSAHKRKATAAAAAAAGMGGGAARAAGSLTPPDPALVSARTSIASRASFASRTSLSSDTGSEVSSARLVGRPLRPFRRPVLTGIYLCSVCSCQEILRRNGRG
jgi:hypothetical protein